MTWSHIVAVRQLPPQPHARPGSGRYEITLACGHKAWRAKSELERDGKRLGRLICRTCKRMAMCGKSLGREVQNARVG